MTKTSLIGVSTLVLVVATAPLARAQLSISAKKISIKGSTDMAKRQIQVQSADGNVLLSAADDPGTSGAALHIYSATDNFCAVLPAGANWKNTGKVWKFADKATKNGAQVGDGKLKVKIKSGVTFDLTDNPSQGAVNVQVQFGTGTRFCMRCSTPTKDDSKKYLAKGCTAASCDPEPSVCTPPTTTTTSTTSTTTTTCVPPVSRTTVKGSLTAGPGRFNYNATLGLPGANAACSASFPGTQPCTLTQLQGAPASDLTCLQDSSGKVVTSFWAIDPNADPLTAQCFDDANFNPVTQPGHNWEYGTAHTPSRGEMVTVDPVTGALGSVQTMVQCNISGLNWVACCQ